MSKSRPFGNLTAFGYDLQFTNMDECDGLARGSKVGWPQNDGVHRWVATTVKPIYRYQKLVGRGARGHTRLTATLRLIALMSLIGPIPLEEGQNIPTY